MNFPEFNSSIKYYIEVKPEQNCYLTVLLVKPLKREYLLVYPNDLNASAILEKNKTHELLRDMRVALQPGVSTSPEYLYFIATSKPWVLTFDSVHKQGPFQIFNDKATPNHINVADMKHSEIRSLKISDQLEALLQNSQGASTAHTKEPDKTNNKMHISENVEVFNTFGDSMPR